MNRRKDQDRLLLENDLGWRLYLWERGHKISYPNSTIRRYLLLFTPVILGVLLILLLWISDVRGQRYELRAVVLVTTILLSVLMGLAASRTMSLRVDSQRGIVNALGFRLSLADIRLLIPYEAHRGRYTLYVSATRIRSRLFFWIPPTRYVAWESRDRSEVKRIMEEVFAATVTTEGPGRFDYIQRRE